MSRGRLTRSLWLRALAYLAIAVALSNALLLGAVDRQLLGPLRQGIAGAAAAALGLFGVDARARADYVQLPQGAVQIVDSCTGLDASLLLAAAMLVFPASWRARLAGIGAGFAILMSLNFVRVLTLAVWVSSPHWFELAHLYVWPTLVVIAALATLLGWMQLAAAREN
jgi:exosortase/archaeosortase family protein